MANLSVSQQRVLAELSEPRRANDVARRLGVDTSAVRRHLDNLVSQGLVESHDVREGPGRPKRFYKVTQAGRELGPRNYPLLLAMLMKKVSEGEGRKKLLKYLESIAADLAAETKSKDAQMRLDLLLAKYNQLGFQAEIRKEDGELVLIQRNCPFLAAANQDPQAICQYFDEGIMRAALPGQDVALDSSLAHGDHVCRHVISKAPRPAAGPG
jgi:DeoR family transcriptional regulator, suf operon transcriptional repressor